MLVHVLDFGADENKSQEIHSYESITHLTVDGYDIQNSELRA